MYSLLLPVGLIALCSRTTAFSSQRQRAISEDDENSYPNCGSCWCIPANNGTGPCPRWEPSSIFRNLTIEAYKGQTPLEIFQLPCNPYEDATCTTEPEQEMVDIESAVCAYQFEDGRGNSIPSLLVHRNDDINATDDAITAHYGADATTDLAPNEHEYVNGIIVDCAMKYRMITYASRAEAEAAGGVVTHTGACGVCSTTQDLALYLSKSPFSGHFYSIISRFLSRDEILFSLASCPSSLTSYQIPPPNGCTPTLHPPLLPNPSSLFFRHLPYAPIPYPIFYHCTNLH